MADDWQEFINSQIAESILDNANLIKIKNQVEIYFRDDNYHNNS
jgi:hypothetical protein